MIEWNVGDLRRRNNRPKKYKVKGSIQEIREGVELVKYLHKNELNQGLKEQLAKLGLLLMHLGK